MWTVTIILVVGLCVHSFAVPTTIPDAMMEMDFDHETELPVDIQLVGKEKLLSQSPLEPSKQPSKLPSISESSSISISLDPSVSPSPSISNTTLSPSTSISPSPSNSISVSLSPMISPEVNISQSTFEAPIELSKRLNVQQEEEIHTNDTVPLAPRVSLNRCVKDLLIAVVSSPSHVNARAAIRDSYAISASESGRATVKFFVGQLPNDFPERAKMDAFISSEPHMVRLHDFTESYHNLSYKALDIFKYAYDQGYCAVLKADDDTYVRVPMILNLLDEHEMDPFLYAGDFVNGKHAVVNDPNSKWYMKDQYPHELEDYANGPGVLLGRRALEFFDSEFDKLFRYRIDDAAIAIWLKDMPMNKVKMKVDSYSYHIHPDTLWINPVNSEEMTVIHSGTGTTLKVCQDTCLCWGGPVDNSPDCLRWEKFSSASYADLIPRLFQVDRHST